jgi:hypothetical protein
MTELRRMLDEEASPLERWLLESATDDVPPDDGPRTLIRALGVGTTLASVTVASTLAQAAAEPVVASAGSATLGAGLGHASAVGVSAAGSAAATGTVSVGTAAVLGSTGAAGAATASKVIVVLGAKWLGAGLVAGALTTGALRVATPPHSPETSAAQMTTSVMSRPEGGKPTRHRVAQRTGMEDRPSTDEAPMDAPGRDLASARTGASVRSMPASFSADDHGPASIGAELALVDEARGRLRSGDASGALEALSRYQGAFRTGTMWPEAARLRCEALRASGNASAAASCAEEFLAAAPTSPHAARMKSMLAGASASSRGSTAAPVRAAAQAAAPHAKASPTRSEPLRAPRAPTESAPGSVASFPDG